MADVFQHKQTGQFYVRGGGNRYIPITEDQVEVAQETDAEAFINSIGNSVAQLGYGAAALAGSPTAQQRFNEFAETQQTRTQASPIASFAGNALPDVAIGIGTGGLAGAGSTALRTAGRQAAVVGMTEGALGAARNPNDPLYGALLQGGAGAVIGGGAPLVSRFTQTAQGVVEGSRRAASSAPSALTDAGYVDPIYAGRGQLAREVGAAVEANPLVNLATGAGRRADNNQAALNRVVMEDIYIARTGDEAAQIDELNAITDGENALTPSFFDAAQERFVQQYRALGDKMDDNVMRDVLSDTQLRSEVSELQGNVSTSVVRNSNVDEVLTRVIERLDDADTSATDLMRMRSDLQQYATQQATSQSGDAAVAEAASSVVEAIDAATTRALEKSGRTEVLDEWKDVTRRYMIFKAAQEGAAVNIGTGNVNATAMARNLDKPRRRNAARSTASFEAARYFAGNATTGVPNSGTATRQLVNQAMTAGAVAGGVSLLN